MENKLIPLQTQEQFEQMYSPDFKGNALIYFTASWCGACKSIDMGFILEEFPDLQIYKCDIDENKYTGGFCGVRSIPNFVLVHPGKKMAGPFQSSNTAKVASWVYSNLQAIKK